MMQVICAAAGVAYEPASAFALVVLDASARPPEDALTAQRREEEAEIRALMQQKDVARDSRRQMVESALAAERSAEADIEAARKVGAGPGRGLGWCAGWRLCAGRWPRAGWCAWMTFHRDVHDFTGGKLLFGCLGSCCCFVRH